MIRLHTLVAVLALTCSGCSDSVTSVHLTRAAAQPEVDRGWIPSVLPASATQICETHDLDTNVGHGTFAFGASDAEQFRAALVPVASAQPLRTHAVSRPEFERAEICFTPTATSRPRWIGGAESESSGYVTPDERGLCGPWTMDVAGGGNPRRGGGPGSGKPRRDGPRYNFPSRNRIMMTTRTSPTPPLT